MTKKSNEKLKATLERKLQLLKDSRHNKMYYAAVLDYHEFVCGTIELTSIMQQLIAEDKIAPVYLKEIFNDFLLLQHLKHEVKPVNHYPNFYTPEIEEKYELMKSFVELIRNDYEEYKRHPNQVFFDPNIPVIKTQRDEEFYYPQKLYNDIVEKLDELNDTIPLEPVLDFDDKNSALRIAGTTLTISQRAESDPHELLRTLFKDKTKVWNNDEVLDDWKIDIDKKTPKTKVYQAAKAVNRIVAMNTDIKDFLLITTKTVGINKKYLPT